MNDKQVVKDIENDAEHSVSLRMCKGELNLAIMAIEKFREISHRYERMDYGLPDNQLDFWTMADIRAERIESNLKTLFNQLKGEDNG